MAMYEAGDSPPPSSSDEDDEEYDEIAEEEEESSEESFDDSEPSAALPAKAAPRAKGKKEQGAAPPAKGQKRELTGWAVCPTWSLLLPYMTRCGVDHAASIPNPQVL
eukprot:gene5184-2603_t